MPDKIQVSFVPFSTRKRTFFFLLSLSEGKKEGDKWIRTNALVEKNEKGGFLTAALAMYHKVIRATFLPMLLI